MIKIYVVGYNPIALNCGFFIITYLYLYVLTFGEFNKSFENIKKV